MRMFTSQHDRPFRLILYWNQSQPSGSSCVGRELTLLRRGIAQYANDMGLRYLIGCSSLTSKDPAEGWQVYRQLEQYRVSPEFETEPATAYICPSEQEG